MKNCTYLSRRIYCLSLTFFLFSFIGFSQQVPKGITARNGEFIGFYQYTPLDYAANPTTKYPLMIFLHGGGEKGDGTTALSRILLGGTPPKLIADGHPMRFFWNGKWETFIVLSPQLNGKYGWWQNFYVEELIDYANKNLRIDPNRIFLTGLSMGGGGTWSYAGASLANAQKLAGIGVSCGACSNPNWCNIANANLPTWAFHATNDGDVPYTCTVGAVNAIGNTCGAAVKPYLTIWPSGWHWIWDRVYDTEHNWQNPNLYEWFLGQDKSLPVNKRPVANAPNQTTTSSVGTATLDASASTDADGTIVRYIWRKLSGPAGGNLVTPISDKGITAVTDLTTEGVYEYEVKIIDNRADWTLQNVTITVVPGAPGTKRPIANAGVDINMYLPNTTTTLNGGASYDPDGTIVKYAWSQLGGPTTATFSDAAIASPVAGNLVLGTYTFRLTVTDNNGISDDDDVLVIVNHNNKLPVAKAGPDISITLPSNSTTLDATGSYDPDGSIKDYEWTRISGPTQFSLANNKAGSTALSNLVEGVYAFQVRVWDNLWTSSNDTVVVIVNPGTPGNKPPVASAGSPVTITLPTNNTSLNGSTSYDPDGTIKTYAWAWVSGPTQYAIGDAAAVTTTLTNLVEGTYTFNLTVTDNGGSSASSSVTVKVNPAPPANKPPVAKAGANSVITLPTNSTNLNGSASTDADGTISTYAWTWISGPTQYAIDNAAAASTTLTNLVEGTYSFKLTVTDNGGLTGTDTVLITVNPVLPPVNKPPVANAGADISITLPVDNTTLNGNASADADGTINSYSWTWISGPTQYAIGDASAVSTALSNLVQGTYSFKLTVTDNGGLTDSDTIHVIVYAAIPANKPPVAYAGADISITLPVDNTTLNGSGSYDPDGTISTRTWTWISGPAQYSIGDPAAASTSLTNLVQGTYVFRHLVTDNGGLTDSDTITVTVHPALPVNKPPTANAGADISMTLPTNNTTLNGNASADADGMINNYSWTWISGPSQYTIGTASAVSTTLGNLVQGTYSFKLTVTDNGGLTDSDTILITVYPAPPPPNKVPVANAGPDIILTLPANSTTLNGNSSADSDGSIVNYTWTWISGPTQYSISNPTAASTALTNLTAGTYLFRLRVVDNKTAADADTVKVVVLPAPNISPIANAGADFNVSMPNPVILLNGNASYDPDGTIAAYTWTRVSGAGTITIANANTISPTVIGVQPGDYVFELTVTDNNGATGKDQIKITVLPAANRKPVAMAGKDTGIAVPSSVALLNGAQSYDPDGVIVSVAWKQVEGPAKATIANPNSVATPAGNLLTGEYIFELTVTDNKGATGKDSITVAVVNNFRYEETLSVYPNPTHGPLNLRVMSDSTGLARITIYDVNGSALRVFTSSKIQSVLEKPLSVADLRPGMYYIEVLIDNKKRLITRFLKQ